MLLLRRFDASLIDPSFFSSTGGISVAFVSAAFDLRPRFLVSCWKRVLKAFKLAQRIHLKSDYTGRLLGQVRQHDFRFH